MTPEDRIIRDLKEGKYMPKYQTTEDVERGTNPLKPQTKAHKLANAAIIAGIVGILGLMVFPLISFVAFPVALVLGFVSLIAYATDHNNQSNR